MANGNPLDMKTVVTAIIGAAFGILVTFVTGVSAQGRDIATLTVKVDLLTKEVRAGMIDRYYGSDATRDRLDFKELLNAVNKRNDRLEEKVDEHINDRLKG